MAELNSVWLKDVNCGSFFDILMTSSISLTRAATILTEKMTSFVRITRISRPFGTESDDAFKEPKSVFSENNSKLKFDLSNELYVPYEDIAQLEWLSTFVEDSFSPGNSLTLMLLRTQFRTMWCLLRPLNFRCRAPISVLESSSSNYAGGKVMPVKLAAPSSGRCGVLAASALVLQLSLAGLQCSSYRPSSSFTKAGNSEFECFGEFGNSFKIRKSAASSTEHKKKKKIKLSESAEVNQNENRILLLLKGSVRKCQHCEDHQDSTVESWVLWVQNSLQWLVEFATSQAGFSPSIVPAASPTFVPTIHFKFA
ncbi:unnamed protein product [Rhodiola kirilowii]